jgi:hypothetical protein
MTVGWGETQALGQTVSLFSIILFAIATRSWCAGLAQAVLDSKRSLIGPQRQGWLTCALLVSVCALIQECQQVVMLKRTSVQRLWGRKSF